MHARAWTSSRCWSFGTTVLVPIAFATVVVAQTPQQALETIGYVRSLIDVKGGLGTAAGKGPDLGSTVAGLRACRYWGKPVEDEERESTVQFVKACFDKASGGFAPQPGGKPDVRSTAMGLMSLVELEQPIDHHSEPAARYFGQHAESFEDIRIAAAAFETIGSPAPDREKWIASVKKMQNADGTFGEGPNHARDTGGAAAALLRLGAKLSPSERAAVVQAIKSGQRPDGGFGRDEGGSDLETTYRVTRCLYMLRERPDAAKLRAFLASCRNRDGGYGVRPGEPSGVGPTYFAGIVTHWLRELEADSGE